jgi:hypothetical protein
MPKYAHLGAELKCPFCDTVVSGTAVVSDLVWFQWGFCRGATPYWPESMYRLGDAIRWKACGDAPPPAWTYFDEDGSLGGANIGDPTFRDLIVSDPFQFQWQYAANFQVIYYDHPNELPSIHLPGTIYRFKSQSDPTKPPPCCNCGEPLEGAVVEIRDGIIQRAWIYKPGEFDRAVHYYLIEADGTIKPMPEWEDHPMNTVSDC